MEIVRDKNRIDKTGEIFTPQELVLEIIKNSNLDKKENMQKSVIDPACGDGNFLVEILKIRLSLGQDPLSSLSLLYGIDLMEDNVEQCKKRLLDIVGNNEAYKKILDKNIKKANSLEIKDFSKFFE